MAPKLLVEDQARRRLLEEIDKAGGQSEFARKHGMAIHFLSSVLHKGRPVNLTIAHALGLVRRTYYVEAGGSELEA